MGGGVPYIYRPPTVPQVGPRGGFVFKLLAQDCAGRVTAVLEGRAPRSNSTPTHKILDRSLIIFIFGKHIQI